MIKVKLNVKGQITIPIKVRKALQLNAGDQLVFVQLAPGRYELMARNKKVTDLKGMFGAAKTSVTIEDMKFHAI